MFKKLYTSYAQLNYPGHQVRESDIDAAFAKKLLFRLATRVLLVCYTLTIFRSGMPVAADFLAHHLWKEAHLQTVHKHDGREHVHLEVYKSVTGSEKDKAAGKFKYEVNESICLIPANSFSIHLRYKKTMTFFDPALYFPDMCRAPDDIPPKVPACEIICMI